jgi:U3 small nucleolar RNA-associated protein 6
MAEFVQQRMEEMVGELNQLQNTGLFDTAEIREIVRKRKALEYKLRRKTKEKKDFLLYIKYEMNVLALIKKRRKANKSMVNVKEIEVPVVKRIHKLFELACTRFKEDVKLWLSHIEFCKQKHEKKRASRLFTSLLKIHPHNADVWILAAKHELEQRLSMQNARGLLQQAIGTNPECRQLWLQYFHMELLNAESLRQKVVDVVGGDLESSESDALVLNGGVANVVYTNACQQFPDDVQLRISFLDIARLFGFTESSVQAIIYEDLETHFSSSEVARCAVAKQPLHKAFALYSQFDSHKDEIGKLERESYDRFDKAVTLLPTETMWSLYLETCLDILQRPMSRRHSRQNVQHTLSVFTRAADSQLLTESMALSWLSVLIKTGQIDEALNASQKLVLHFSGSVELWTERVSIVMRTATEAGVILQCIDASVDACISSREESAVELWRLIMNWCVSNCPQRVTTLCERGLLAQSASVCHYIKQMYLDFTAIHSNINVVRNLYRRLVASQPSSVDLVDRYIAIELSQVKPKMKHIRHAYEGALLTFGTKNIDVWLSYIKMELTDARGKPENVSHLSWRAEKNLDAALVDAFKQQFSELTSSVTNNSNSQ